MFFVIGDRDIHLRPPCVVCRYQRQKPVRRTACDDLDRTFVLQLAKRADKISMIAVVPKTERGPKIFGVHPSDVLIFERFGLSSKDFLIGKLKKIFKMTSVAFL